MPGRFDPVRDSTAISPTQAHTALDGRKYPHSSPFESQDEGEVTTRVRRPSRSASIADILNDEPVEPIRRSVSGELGDGPGHGPHDSGGYGRSVYYGSSPSSSVVGLPETSHRPHLLEMSYETGEGGESSSSLRSYALRRQSSSHSASSSSDFSLHQQFSSQQAPLRSPSMLHLLHSDGPRSAPLPAQSEARPRSRGPSFAGGFSILSPTTDVVPNGKQHLGNVHPVHRQEEPHTSMASSRHDLPDSSKHGVVQASDQSYFAIPDVPFRSPEVMRNRKALPLVTVSPLSTSQSLPPAHPTVNETEVLDHSIRVLPQPTATDMKPTAPSKVQAPPPGSNRAPYKPTNRVSVPTTVRQPVTAEQVSEMRHQCQNSLRIKWQRSHPGINDGFDKVVVKFAEQMKVSASAASKASSQSSSIDLKRKREEEEDNARLVAHHYNSRQDQGLNVRKQSPILPLRNFNNWVKSVLIGSNAKAHGRVLDLGGGKGGDLNKWDKAGIDEYILCDIAAVSIEQAESRFKERRYHFNAQFFAFDCFGVPLADNIPKALLEPLFDNVSLQFCLHYGWESVHKAQLMLENIARYLKPGGIFVGTIPNADLLRDRLSIAMSGGESKPETFFGNHCYRVAFDPSDEKNAKMPPFGHKYNFTLLDAVDDVAEYVVDWDQFISLARQNGLECIFKKTFEEMWREEGQMDRHRELARRMKIFSNGLDGIPMNDELWEATGLYLAFAFQKVDKQGRI